MQNIQSNIFAFRHAGTLCELCEESLVFDEEKPELQDDDEEDSDEDDD
jgi:hypothetical protein